MQENNYLKLPQMSNKHWCWKNEQHLNIEYNFYHQMSLSNSNCWYWNNCLDFLKRAGPFELKMWLSMALKNLNMGARVTKGMYNKTFLQMLKC